MRLIRHIAPGTTSPKAIALRSTVRTEYAKNANVTDPERIDSLKAGAIRALSNYMLFESGTKDKKLGVAMNRFNDDVRKGLGGGGGGGSWESIRMGE